NLLNLLDDLVLGITPETIDSILRDEIPEEETQKMIDEDMELEVLNNSEEEISEKANTIDKDVEIAPVYMGPEWEPFLLSKLKPEELEEGQYPKVNGLRRLAQRYLGLVVFSGPLEYTSHHIDARDPGRSTCMYEVRIRPYFDMNIEMVFRGVSGQCIANAPSPEFMKHPEAMAETRAEVRALRKALGISVVSSEELAGKETDEVIGDFIDETDGVYNEKASVSANQIEAIRKIITRLELDEFKVLEYMSLGSLESITKGEGTMLLKKLHQWQLESEKYPELEGLKSP
ncbi:MAG: hypothetical protein ACFFG0_27725, partial [Candidatus Thorarchaeota archaeon]